MAVTTHTMNHAMKHGYEMPEILLRSLGLRGWCEGRHSFPTRVVKHHGVWGLRVMRDTFVDDTDSTCRVTRIYSTVYGQRKQLLIDGLDLRFGRDGNGTSLFIPIFDAA